MTAPNDIRRDVDGLLRSLEAERCRAINERDIDALDPLLAEGYVHIHASGRVEDRDRLLEALRTGAPRTTVRGELRIVVHGDTAVMIGGVESTIRPEGEPPRSIVGTAAQTWSRVNERWKLVSFQVTPSPPV